MLDQTLLVAHFVGLAMGLSSGFANMVMAGVVAKAAPAEKAILARFPPAMSRIGVIGLALLWVSGAALVMTRYGGFGVLPGAFHAKLTTVILLTLVVAYINVLMPKAQRGDTAAMARIQMLGKMTGPLAILAIILAVVAFG